MVSSLTCKSLGVKTNIIVCKKRDFHKTTLTHRNRRIAISWIRVGPIFEDVFSDQVAQLQMSGGKGVHKGMKYKLHNKLNNGWMG